MSEEPNPETAELLTRFLLGQLSEQERKTVEERFLADDEYFEQLLVMEDSLVDDYVLGQLNEEEKKNADLLFRSSAAAKKEVNFTEDLVANLKRRREAKAEAGKRKNKQAVATDEIVAPKTSRWLQSQASLNLIAAGLKGLPKGFTATAGLVVLLLAGASIFLLYQYQRQTRELLVQQAALERSVQEARQKLNDEIQNSSELGKRLDRETELRTQAEEALAQVRTPEPKSIISLVLLPTIFQRTASSKTVTLNAAANRLQLLLEVPSDRSYPNYNVVIKTFDGHQVWSRDSIPATQIKQSKLSLIFSSSLFPYNDYRLELHGVPETGASQLVADYAFKVRK
jgi:DNA repair exonuclease SbcCD ATPase subunit